MTVNGKIIEMLRFLREDLEVLREYERISLEQFHSDKKIQAIVEREFEKAVMTCTDIGARIISAKRMTPVSSYVEVFERLREHRVVQQGLAEKLKDLVRFRNVLTHEYYRIAPEKVHEKLTTCLDVFVEFAKHVEACVA